MAGKLRFLNAVINDDSHPVLAEEEKAIDCSQLAARGTDCGSRAHAIKEVVNDHKTPCSIETTGDDTAHAVIEKHDDHIVSVVRETYDDDTGHDIKDICDDLLHKKLKTNGKSTVHGSEHVDDNQTAVAVGDTVAKNQTFSLKNTVDDHSAPVAIDKDGNIKTDASKETGYDHTEHYAREIFSNNTGYAAMEIAVDISAISGNNSELVPSANETAGNHDALLTLKDSAGVQTSPAAGGQEWNFQNMVIPNVLQYFIQI